MTTQTPAPIIGPDPGDATANLGFTITANRITVERSINGPLAGLQESGVYFDVAGTVPGLDFEPQWCFVPPDEPERIQWHAVGHPVGHVVIPAVLDEAARILRLHGVEVTR